MRNSRWDTIREAVVTFIFVMLILLVMGIAGGIERGLI